VDASFVHRRNHIEAVVAGVENNTPVDPEGTAHAGLIAAMLKIIGLDVNTAETGPSSPASAVVPPRSRAYAIPGCRSEWLQKGATWPLSQQEHELGLCRCTVRASA
jgi:hypothetical protein